MLPFLVCQKFETKMAKMSGPRRTLKKGLREEGREDLKRKGGAVFEQKSASLDLPPHRIL